LRRLWSKRERLPKPLVRLSSGKSILQHQLEALSQYISLDQVVLVVGYKKELILEQFPNLLYVYNPNYAVENTSKSLLRALKKWDEDLLWLNGDVLFHPSVLEGLFKASKTCMLVNAAPVHEEEVKYRLDQRPEFAGRIVEVSKSVFPADGEALGINYCRREHLEPLIRHLMACEDQDYFERGIQQCINEGIPVGSECVDQSLCIELDFPEDLERANSLLIKWK
jgi:L-glutamine-phosphate cytidylyltransferase